MLSKDKTAYIFLILATLFWSGNFIVGKSASFFEIPPFTLNFYRWTFAWLIGVTSITLFNSIVYYSLQFTQVISGVLMISTIPVMIILFSSLLKIEKTNFFQLIGVFFSMLGVIVIVSQLNLEKIKELNFNIGDLSIIVAMLSWALYSALLKRKKLELSQLSL